MAKKGQGFSWWATYSSGVDKHENEFHGHWDGAHSIRAKTNMARQVWGVRTMRASAVDAAEAWACVKNHGRAVGDDESMSETTGVSHSELARAQRRGEEGLKPWTHTLEVPIRPSEMDCPIKIGWSRSRVHSNGPNDTNQSERLRSNRTVQRDRAVRTVRTAPINSDC